LAIAVPGYAVVVTAPEDRDRLRRRDAFLRELADAKALRERIAPRRTRRIRANQLHRMLTYRHC
jgi:hypothetical protein